MDDPGLIDLETTILLLPPVSRAAHLDGPLVHAQHLVKLWKVDAGANTIVPLALAFRLLDVKATAGAISRAAASEDYSSRSRYWDLPNAQILLSELRAAVWQAMLEGTLSAEAIKGVQGNRYGPVLPAELPRLRPDMQLSRLTLGGRDEFIDVRIRRAPSMLAATESADIAAFTGQQIASGTMVAAEAADAVVFAPPIQRPWGGGRLLPAQLRAAIEEIERRDYPNARNDSNTRPTFSQMQTKLNNYFGTEVPQRVVRTALKNFPHLKRGRGQRMRANRQSRSSTILR